MLLNLHQSIAPPEFCSKHFEIASPGKADELGAVLGSANLDNVTCEDFFPLLAVDCRHRAFLTREFNGNGDSVWGQEWTVRQCMRADRVNQEGIDARI
jgi:hypothetical protein